VEWSNSIEMGTKIKKIKKISQDKYRITLQYVDGFQGVADHHPAMSLRYRGGV
jgi:hypothetical protein